MNKNQVNGIAKDIAGKVQEKVGDITGSTSQQAKGIQKQISGQAEEKLGDAKEL
ncbi:MAG: CsbD family protein [Burkholderiales bacterium]|nr:CsbD family protein [Burkholderiales bacterium]